MLITIGTEITVFGFGLCLLQAVERIIESRRVFSPRVFFYVFNSVIILATGLVVRGVPIEHPLSLFLFPSALLIIGPLNLFYYHTLLYPGKAVPYRTRLHLAPFFLALAGEIFFQTRPDEFKRALISSLMNDPVGNALFPLLVLASLHVLIYMLYIARVFLFELGFKKSHSEYRFIGSIALTVLLIIALLFWGFVLKKPLLFIGGGVLNVLLHVYIYLGVRLFPHFFTALKAALEKKGYEKSMLVNIDKENFRSRLERLMINDELFMDSEITLPAVARRLSLSPHQLSELLNEHMGTGFHDFVNGYRIARARDILMKDGNVNITSLCYSVGFNSKSSFNSAFKKITGKTPREFRGR
jgi:AraC-like DNA-binding protein